MNDRDLEVLMGGPQRLGPLTPLVGEWEGDVGVDLSYHNDDNIIGVTSAHGHSPAAGCSIDVRERHQSLTRNR